MLYDGAAITAGQHHIGCTAPPDMNGTATAQQARASPPEADPIHALTRTRLLILPAIVLLLVTACGPSGSQGGRSGESAPPLVATALDGTTVDLASLRGKPVIINFWASWCVPCREEFPLFNERLAVLGPADGLQIIGVLYKDEPELAQRFLDDMVAPWPTVDDPDGALAAAYRVAAPPQTYFVDGEGVVRGIQIGEVQASDFDTQYAKIRP